MSRSLQLVIAGCLGVATAVGIVAARLQPAQPANHARRILYYHDPMHPDYRSDQPGVAPDCGMQLEPVYSADTVDKISGPAQAAPAGAVQLSTAKQQIAGVQVEEVHRSAVSRTIRLLARVVPDETRTFMINAPVDGWIQDGGTATTGSFVKKGEKLGSFYNADFLVAQQTYIVAHTSTERQEITPAGSRDVHPAAEQTTPNIRQQTENQRFVPMSGVQASNLQRYANVLRNLGMSETQIEEIGRTHTPAREVSILAPADGVVLSRNISTNQRFGRGEEWFRVADLRTVWIVADAFENDARSLADVRKAVAHYRGEAFQVHMTGTPPVYDAATRTLKLRMTANNPGFQLRPGMFVDVDLSVSHSPEITVPRDAISETGLRKMVYVNRENGLFEPKPIQAGPPIGDRVVVESGLEPGDRILTSGNFLVDSESRLQLASSAPVTAASTDPVCGMTLDATRARKYTGVYGNRSYVFCSGNCKNKFYLTPDKYVSSAMAKHLE